MPARFSLAAMGSSSSGTTFIVNEDCEGTGTPSGWATTSGSPNWDYSAVPLEGAQSLYLTTASASHRTFVNFTDMSEIWIYLLMRITNGAGPAAATAIASLQTSVPSLIGALLITGVPRLQFPGTAVTPVTPLVLDTTTHVWLHYKQGSGANAIFDAGLSTDGVRPTSGNGFAQVTNNSSTALAGRFTLGPSTTTLGYDLIYDKIRIAATQIGDNGS